MPLKTPLPKQAAKAGALTDYQNQAHRRIRKALSKRASADRKVRALATRLATALADADQASTHLTTLNGLYGTGYQGRTDLAQQLHDKDAATVLTDATTNHAAGVPDQVYAVVANGNGGVALAADPDLD